MHKGLNREAGGAPKAHISISITPVRWCSSSRSSQRRTLGQGIKRKLGRKTGSSLACLLRFSPVHTYMYTTKPLNDLAGFSPPLLMAFHAPSLLRTICCHISINPVAPHFSKAHHASLKIPTLCSLWKCLIHEALCKSLIHGSDTRRNDHGGSRRWGPSFLSNS